MKLLTHNRLVCVRKGCDNAFPLQIVFREVEEVNDDEPEQAVAKTLHLLPRIDYPVLRGAAEALEIKDLPEELPALLDPDRDAELVVALHRVLFNVSRSRTAAAAPCRSAQPSPSKPSLPISCIFPMLRSLCACVLVL